MRVLRYPEQKCWADILKRPLLDTAAIESSVRSIIEAVRSGGDTEIRRLTLEFDSVEINELEVNDHEIVSSAGRVREGLKAAIRVAYKNISAFHSAQAEEPEPVETVPGVMCWRESVPIERVGLYIPGGTAPLFSSVLMLTIPAQIAGCREIILCTPPNSEGEVDSNILYVAALCGVSKIFKIGGAQAIAAMAYGTESVPSVDKIFGPGNRYVTGAKQLVSMDVAIDMPAGPSEVAVIADSSCNPSFVAADLLSQAEHGTDSQVLLITNNEMLIEQTLAEIERQLSGLSRRETAGEALRNSTAILTRSLDEALAISNAYAPEHLILAVENAKTFALGVMNAGSVFIGDYSCESAGDYASGTNHTLPTAGFARSFSGLSLDSFVKKITFQEISKDGLWQIGPAIQAMAAAEGLDAHGRAVSIRLEQINGL